MSNVITVLSIRCAYPLWAAMEQNEQKWEDICLFDYLRFSSHSHKKLCFKSNSITNWDHVRKGLFREYGGFTLMLTCFMITWLHRDLCIATSMFHRIANKFAINRVEKFIISWFWITLTKLKPGPSEMHILKSSFQLCRLHMTCSLKWHSYWQLYSVGICL